MRVFVTGATGFVGTAVVQELIQAGHQVLGLARSDAAAAALLAAGAEVQRGDLEDLASLRRGVVNADGVIHAGFIHDFARFQAVCETDERAIEAIGAELAGSNRPFIVTSGAALVAPGRVATEADLHQAKSATYPRASEHAAMVLAANGVNASVVRLPPSVHGAGDHGFVPILINLAREKGVSAYLDEGLNRWTAVHRQDAAKVYRLALEQASAGARYHAIAEEGIAFKEIAEVIGRHLHVPVVAKSGDDAAKHFGWFTGFAKIDCPASSQLTRVALGWQPEQTGLIADIETADYFKTEQIALEAIAKLN